MSAGSVPSSLTLQVRRTRNKGPTNFRFGIFVFTADHVDSDPFPGRRIRPESSINFLLDSLRNRSSYSPAICCS